MARPQPIARHAGRVLTPPSRMDSVRQAAGSRPPIGLQTDSTERAEMTDAIRHGESMGEGFFKVTIGLIFLALVSTVHRGFAQPGGVAIVCPPDAFLVAPGGLPLGDPQIQV